jgi:hypothetical protein
MAHPYTYIHTYILWCWSVLNILLIFWIYYNFIDILTTFIRVVTLDSPFRDIWRWILWASFFLSSAILLLAFKEMVSRLIFFYLSHLYFPRSRLKALSSLRRDQDLRWKGVVVKDTGRKLKLLHSSHCLFLYFLGLQHIQAETSCHISALHKNCWGCAVGNLLRYCGIHILHHHWLLTRKLLHNSGLPCLPITK